jgi:hypothetical protein
MDGIMLLLILLLVLGESLSPSLSLYFLFFGMCAD